jgi:Tfp pilus assembly protein PilX
MLSRNLSKVVQGARCTARRGERGAALTMTMIMMVLIGAISVAVLSVVTNEARISGSDMRRMKTFYAASAGLEKMTSDFSDEFQHTSKPTQQRMNEIADDPPTALVDTEGFTFKQTLTRNDTLLQAMKDARGGKSPTTTIPNGPFSGMFASVEPYHLTSVASHPATKTQVRLERDVNNYMVPLFQFATFSDKDLEFWPEPPMTFNGRIHANGNIYFGGDITFLDRVTTAGEAVRTVLRNKATNTTLVGGYFGSDPRFIDTVSNLTAHMKIGSVTGGPNMGTGRADGRGNFPGSPTGTDNSATWASSTNALDGTDNHFGTMLKTASTGARQLLLPLQLDGRSPLEIIKRSMPDDNTIMSQSRYHSKAEVRIIIDDEQLPSGVTTNVAGIPAGKGVLLSQWLPSELDGGNAMRVIDDNGNYLATSSDWYQGDVSGSATKRKAMTVRGVRNDYLAAIQASGTDSATGGLYAKTTGTAPTEYTKNFTNASIPKTSNGTIVPPGSGIKGRILIELVEPDGKTTLDVTQQVLSMGVTVGEPNAIVHLQRPLWAAFIQGSRDRSGGNDYLTYFMDNSRSDRRALADGEINISTGLAMDAAGYLDTPDNSFDDDPHGTGATAFQPVAATMDRDDKPDMTGLNQIVPINVYNVREGHINDGLTATSVYSRGITSVVELNMRNLARWLDGVYDTNLLNGTNAVSTNIGSPDGWIVYVSDRRGDRPKDEKDSTGTVIKTTNGYVDNEDIYNYPASAGATPEPGEDVIDTGYDVALGKDKLGSLQHDLLELPDPAAITSTSTTPPSGYTDSANYGQALAVGKWATSNQTTAGTAGYYFRRAVRLFNGEDLKISGATDKLSETKGLTVATENMVYIWGNYNTTGISCQPSTGSTLNDPAQTCHYNGDQVPASIAADSFFPISKTWFDSVSAMYPEGANSRIADAGSGGVPMGSSAITVGQETAVRTGIIAGSTLSAMVGNAAPSPNFLLWLNGGVHNFPRFLETWSTSGTGWEKRWNYVGSFIILYNSTQAVGPWSVTNSVNYYPPRRNWSFDITFTDPNRLPPGTPQFQFVQATGFRETPCNTTSYATGCS